MEDNITGTCLLPSTGLLLSACLLLSTCLIPCACLLPSSGYCPCRPITQYWPTTLYWPCYLVLALLPSTCITTYYLHYYLVLALLPSTCTTTQYLHYYLVLALLPSTCHTTQYWPTWYQPITYLVLAYYLPSNGLLPCTCLLPSSGHCQCRLITQYWPTTQYLPTTQYWLLPVLAYYLVLATACAGLLLSTDQLTSTDLLPSTGLLLSTCLPFFSIKIFFDLDIFQVSRTSYWRSNRPSKIESGSSRLKKSIRPLRVPRPMMTLMHPERIRHFRLRKQGRFFPVWIADTSGLRALKDLLRTRPVRGVTHLAPTIILITTPASETSQTLVTSEALQPSQMFAPFSSETNQINYFLYF